MPDFPTPAPTREKINLGAESKLYYNSAATVTPATWVPLLNASDNSVGEEDDDVTITRKGAGPRKEHIGGATEFPLEFTMRNSKRTVAEAKELLLILASKHRRKTIDFLSLDGDIADPASVGWRGAWRVQSVKRDEKDLSDASYAVKCVPGDDLANPPRLVYSDGEGGIVDYEEPAPEEP